MEAASKENKVWHSVSAPSRGLNEDNICTFKNTSQQVYDMALTMCWQSDLILLHLCSTLWIVFFSVVTVP